MIMRGIFRCFVLMHIAVAFAFSFLPNVLNRYHSSLPRVEAVRGVSIIVPLRNEETRLAPLLESLSTQRYENFEVIFVNDGSTDRTVEIVRNFSEGKENVKIVHAIRGGNKLTHYQNALTAGVAHAEKEILFFTNAGCSFDENLLGDLASYYCDDSVGAVVMRYGPSDTKGGLIESIHLLGEQLLSDLCQAFIAFHGFLGAKGACLSYSRKAYLDLKGQYAIEGKTNEDIAFTNLVHKSKYKVIASPLFVGKLGKKTFSELSSQHVRWLKGLHVLGATTGFVVAVSEFLYHLYAITSLLNPSFDLLAKFLGDYMLTRNLNYNAGSVVKISDEIKTAITFPFYYVAVFAMSIIPSKMKWK